MPFNAIVAHDPLDTFIDSIATIVSESRIHLEDNGLRVAAVNPANVVMTHAMLGAGAFEAYDADGGGLIGVNLERIEDVLGFAGSDDLTHWWLDDETRKLHGEVADLEVTHALIDPESIRQEPDSPDLDLASTVVLEGSKLDRAIRAGDMVSDHVTFRANEDAQAFYVEARGDTDDVDLEVDADDLLPGTTLVGEHEALYSLDYLKDLNTAIPNGGEVTLRVGDDLPCEMKFQYSDGFGTCTYTIAPRIQG